jgi:hypothetical protein
LFTCYITGPITLTAPSSPFDTQKLVDVKECGRETILCLAAAHALVRLDNDTIVGDPMEKTTLEALDWSLGEGTVHVFNHSMM